MKGEYCCSLIPLLRLCSLTATISIHSPLTLSSLNCLPTHPPFCCAPSPIPPRPATTTSHSVCLLWDMKGALSLLFICMHCRGLEAEESGTFKSLLCVCVYLNLVSVILDLSLQLKSTYTGPLVLVSVGATLNVIVTHSIFILIICYRVHYHSSLVESNFLLSYNLFAGCKGFRDLFFLPVVYFPLSLSDLPPEGSS